MTKGTWGEKGGVSWSSRTREMKNMMRKRQALSTTKNGEKVCLVAGGEELQMVIAGSQPASREPVACDSLYGMTVSRP